MMKTNIRFIFMLAAAATLLIFQGCSEKTHEGGKSLNAPFSDGLYFTYDVFQHSGGSTIRGHETFTIDSIDAETFKVARENYTHMPDGRQVLVMHRIFIVNRNGIVEDSELRSYEGGYCPLWIPVGTLNVGEYLRDAGMKVFEKINWKVWETYRISDKPDSINFYYELDKGFLVGTDGTGLRQDLTLIENNAGVPVSR